MHDTHTQDVGGVQPSIVMVPGSDDSQAEAGLQPEAAAADNFSIRSGGDTLCSGNKPNAQIMNAHVVHQDLLAVQHHLVQPESASSGNSSALKLASGNKSAAVMSADSAANTPYVSTVKTADIALSGMKINVSFSSVDTSVQQTEAHHHRDPVGAQEAVIGDQSAVLSSTDGSDYSEYASPLQGTQSPGTADNVFVDTRPRVDCHWCNGKRKADNPVLDDIPRHGDRPCCDFCKDKVDKMFGSHLSLSPGRGPDQPPPVAQRGVLFYSPTSRDSVPASGVGFRPPGVEDLGVAHQPVLGMPTCRAQVAVSHVNSDTDLLGDVSLEHKEIEFASQLPACVSSQSLSVSGRTSLPSNPELTALQSSGSVVTDTDHHDKQYPQPAHAPLQSAMQKETPRTLIKRLVATAPQHKVNNALVADSGAHMYEHNVSSEKHPVSIQHAHDISHSLPLDHDGLSVNTHASDDHFNAELPQASAHSVSLQHVSTQSPACKSVVSVSSCAQPLDSHHAMLPLVESKVNSADYDRGDDSGTAVLRDGKARVLATCVGIDQVADAQAQNAVLKRKLSELQALLEVQISMSPTQTANVKPIDLSFIYSKGSS